MKLKVYHNPKFLDYLAPPGVMMPNMNDIVVPARPLATVTVNGDLSHGEALQRACIMTQHVDWPWWEGDDVLLHVRSTAIGDVIEDDQRRRFVVESHGFRALLQQEKRPEHIARALLDRLGILLDMVADDRPHGEIYRETNLALAEATDLLEKLQSQAVAVGQ